MITRSAPFSWLYCISTIGLLELFSLALSPTHGHAVLRVLTTQSSCAGPAPLRIEWYVSNVDIMRELRVLWIHHFLMPLIVDDEDGVVESTNLRSPILNEVAEVCG